MNQQMRERLVNIISMFGFLIAYWNLLLLLVGTINPILFILILSFGSLVCIALGLFVGTIINIVSQEPHIMWNWIIRLKHWR